MLARPQLKESPHVKVLINLGSLMDIPTGHIIKGKYGESIINGGLGMLTGIIGIGNSFKSTILHYMLLSAANKVSQCANTYMNTYDTELNIHRDRLYNFTQTFDTFRDKNILEDGTWVITDKSVYMGDEWFEEIKKFLKTKTNDEKLLLETPFLDKNNELFKIPVPTFTEIDSFSDFETSDVSKLQNENELGESGGRMVHMQQGGAKVRLLMQLPVLLNSSYNFTLITAHLGKESQIATGPFAPQPTKKLFHLRQGDKIKGVTDKFTYIANNCWYIFSAGPMYANNTKTPEYPVNNKEVMEGDPDLNEVVIKQLRSKSGQSGVSLTLIVSQREGLLPTLTEFHFIKEYNYFGVKRFGITGNNTTYHLDLLPEVNITRTTIRSKINENKELRRAINITSELAQMHIYWRFLDADLLCDAKTLYEDLIKLGYDWKVLLNTRGYWLFNNDKHEVPFLSTIDLLNMRVGKYRPYWLK